MQSIARQSVSGFIDGSVIVFSEEDGSISFRLTVGAPDSAGPGGGHIEFIVSREAARELAEAIGSGSVTSTTPIQCALGMRVLAPLPPRAAPRSPGI